MASTRHPLAPTLGRLAFAAIAAALLVVATPVRAQTSGAPPAAEEIDQATLESFAAAALEVEAISMDWSERMAGVQDTEELETMREQAQAELVEAVRDEGLTVETYNTILEVAQVDPDLNARVQQLMREEAGQ